jgi:hypothetical protein
VLKGRAESQPPIVRWIEDGAALCHLASELREMDGDVD